MASRLTGIKLHSQELAEFLKNGTEVEKAVNNAASEIESEMVPSIEESKAKAEGSKKSKKQVSNDQIVKKEVTTANDGRYQVQVQVKNMSNVDFVFGTIPRAIYRAGGKRSKR